MKIKEPEIHTYLVSNLKDTLDYLETIEEGIKSKLLTWFDGDVNKMERLNLPEDKDCKDSWAYMKGIRNTILIYIPQFEHIRWTGIDVY